eukprot:5909335-Pleurochrysis_carterae.AAC.1
MPERERERLHPLRLRGALNPACALACEYTRALACKRATMRSQLCTLARRHWQLQSPRLLVSIAGFDGGGDVGFKRC